ncbi:MAG: hypothetical protein ACJAYU_004557 [Bradymonadia bacterium]
MLPADGQSMRTFINHPPVMQRPPFYLATFVFLGACGSDTKDPVEPAEVGVDIGTTDTAADAPDAVADVGADVGEDTGQGVPEVTTDLVPWSRLDAPLARTGERADDLRNGPGAIRDGDPDTGWLAPPLGGRLVVDWQPWLGSSTEIYSVVLELESPAPVDVRLLDGCGGNVVWEAAANGETTVFDVGGVVGACLEVELEEGRVTGLRVDADGELEPPPLPIGARDPIDILFPGFGVFEGHSGPVWSWQERDALLRAHALHGLGTYVYAPEGDLFRSSDWRSPYPNEWMEEFGRLASLATDLEFALTFGISPFADWTEGDTATLISKLQTIADAGATSFVIMGDGVDAATVDADLGQAQLAAVGAVVAWMSETSLEGKITFFPSVVTEAERNSAADGSAYLGALAELPDEVVVLWSGAESWNAAFNAEELDAHAAATGQPAGLLDSYWAGPSTRLGTYTGREGLQIRPPIWIRTGARPGIARFNLHQFAHWTQQRPGGPQGARDFAAVVEQRWGLREIEGDFHSELLNQIARAFDGAGPADPRFEDYEDVIDTLVGDLEAGAPSDRSVQDALTQFAQMAAIRSVVWHSPLASDLVDDLWLGLDYLRVEGERGLWALTELRERLGGRSTADAEAELDLLTAAIGALPADTSPDAFDRLYEGVQEVTSVEDAPESLLFYEPPERCFAQASLGWTPFPDATWIAIAGLPGATVDGDFVQWFAENAGEYRAVIVATAGMPTTWNFRIVDIVCRPEN